MITERDSPPLNRRVENKQRESKVVPLRSTRCGSGIADSPRPDRSGVPAGEGQATITNPMAPRMAGLQSDSDALALLPVTQGMLESDIGQADIPSWKDGPPQRILLATDLSFRCERALNRAAALSAHWQSALVVLHVLDTSDLNLIEPGHRPSWHPSAPRNFAWKRLLDDVSAITRKATLLMREGDPAEAIAHTAEAEHCDLIVVGIAQETFLGRVLLDRTVDRLLRRSRVPLLIVKERPRKPYHHIVVATDFSDASRHALEATVRIFPGTAVTIFHAHQAPRAGLTMNSKSYRTAYQKLAERECEEFLKKVRKPAAWQPSRIVIEDGAPNFLLRDCVRDLDIDLVVLGTRGRNAIFEMIVGSVAKAIMDEVPCDILVIREPRAADEV